MKIKMSAHFEWMEQQNNSICHFLGDWRQSGEEEAEKEKKRKALMASSRYGNNGIVPNRKRDDKMRIEKHNSERRCQLRFFNAMGEI